MYEVAYLVMERVSVVLVRHQVFVEYCLIENAIFM